MTQDLTRDGRSSRAGRGRRSNHSALDGGLFSETRFGEPPRHDIYYRRRALAPSPPETHQAERQVMATERQIAANRQNASRSKGPVSDSGKARSRLNSTKHGLAAESAQVEEGLSAE